MKDREDDFRDIEFVGAALIGLIAIFLLTAAIRAVMTVVAEALAAVGL